MSDEKQSTEMPAEGGDERPLVVLARDGDEETGIASLSDLGREVVTLDPGLLDGEAFSRLGDAVAVIVPWDLGSQAGLDVVEALRTDERTQHTPIVMSSAAPTRAAVRMALKAGATGFIFQPLDPDDVRRHLAASSAAGSEPEGQGSGEAAGDG